MMPRVNLQRSDLIPTDVLNISTERLNINKYILYVNRLGPLSESINITSRLIDLSSLQIPSISV